MSGIEACQASQEDVVKKMLSYEELDGQTAVELPDRELMAPVVIGGGLIVVGVGDITVNIEDVEVCPAANVNIISVGEVTQTAEANC